MPRKKHLIIFTVILVIGIISIFIFNNFLPIEIKYKNLIETGNRIIKELDIYYSINNFYPDRDILNENYYKTIEDIYGRALQDDNIKYLDAALPTYYKKNNEYLLIFPFGIDSPELFYYSATKKWQYGIAQF